MAPYLNVVQLPNIFLEHSLVFGSRPHKRLAIDRESTEIWVYVVVIPKVLRKVLWGIKSDTHYAFVVDLDFRKQRLDDFIDFRDLEYPCILRLFVE